MRAVLWKIGEYGGESLREFAGISRCPWIWEFSFRLATGKLATSFTAQRL